MRVLLDECVPKRLGRSFPAHDVRTIPQMNWCGKKNGELLSLMTAAGFEVLLTVDQNIVHQQNLQAAGVAVVVLVARTSWPTFYRSLPMSRPLWRTSNPATLSK